MSTTRSRIVAAEKIMQMAVELADEIIETDRTKRTVYLKGQPPAPNHWATRDHNKDWKKVAERFEMARQAIAQAEADIGRNEDVQHLYAMTYYLEGTYYVFHQVPGVWADGVKGLKLADQALKHRDDANIRYLRGSALKLQRKKQDALRELELALTMNPEPEIAVHIKESIEELKKGCFIATAVYGDYHSPEVQVLRRFRDEVLRKCCLGRVFVNFYYRFSPSWASLVSMHPRLRKALRQYLCDPCVRCLRKAMHY